MYYIPGYTSMLTIYWVYSGFLNHNPGTSISCRAKPFKDKRLQSREREKHYNLRSGRHKPTLWKEWSTQKLWLCSDLRALLNKDSLLKWVISSGCCRLKPQLLLAARHSPPPPAPAAAHVISANYFLAFCLLPPSPVIHSFFSPNSLLFYTLHSCL